MPESNITASLIPLALPYETGEPIKNEDGDCKVTDKNPKTELTVEYPAGFSTIPLAGGAVISLPYADYKSNKKVDTVKIFADEINSISGLDQTGDRLDILTRMRNAVNSSLKSIGKKDSVRKKLKLPKIFISTFLGDDSEFEDKTDQAVARVIKICEMNYIPLEVLEEISKLIVDIDALLAVNGVSGKTFLELATPGGNDWVSDLVLEFMPIYNISEDEIVKRGISTGLGGFYTFDEENEVIYMKLPDLSGKDSFGFAPDIYTDRNLYLEILPGSSIQRIKLDDFSYPPSISFTDDFPDEFQEKSSLEITVESNKELTAGYLSVISKSGTVDNITGISASSNGYEIYTAPILTQPVVKGENATYKISRDFSTDEYVEATRAHLKDIYDVDAGLVSPLVGKGSIESIGIASDMQYTAPSDDYINFSPNPDTFFGESNRPEVVLLDNERKKPKKSNDRKYWGTKIPEARSLFAEVRPKIYTKDQIPGLWIKTTQVEEDEDGNYEFSFAASDLSVLIQENIGDMSFVFYAQDLEGQLARAPKAFSLAVGDPSIDNRIPTGFSNSNEISPFKIGRLTFTGVNLGATQRLKFVSESGQILNFEKGTDSDTSITVSENRISFNSYITLQELGFTSTSTYEVFAETDLGKSSSPVEIYISDGDGGQKDAEPVNPKLDRDDILYFAHTGNAIATEIPIDPGQNSLLKVKCRSPYFNGDYSMFAYLATTKANSASLLQVDLNTSLIDITGAETPSGDSDLTIASGISFELSQSFVGQDFYRISNRKAGVKIPGDEYSSRNYSALTAAGHDFYLIFTSLAIGELTKDASTLKDKDYFVMQLGNTAKEEPAFINPPLLYGIAARTPNSEDIVSSFPFNGDFEKIYDTFGVTIGNQKVAKISTFKKLPNLAIIFYGDGDSNPNKRYKFFIGNTKINNKLAGKIEPLTDFDDRYIAFFEDIKITDQGDFSVYVTKKNRDYGITSSSETVNRTGTFYIAADDMEYDKSAGELSILSDIDKLSTGDSTSGLIQYGGTSLSTILSQIIPSTGSGISLKDEPTSLLFNEIDLTSNFDLTLSSEGKDLKVLKQIKETDVSQLDKDTLVIPGGTKILSNNIIIDVQDSPTEGLAFLNLEVGNPNTISFNEPVIFALKEGGSGAIDPDDDPNAVSIIGGEEYSVLVRASEKRFSLVFDDLYVVRPKNVKRISENEWSATFKAPKAMIGSGCPEVAGSVSNFGRNGAKIELGNKFVVDIQKKMFGLIDGIGKVKVPDLDDLKDLIENFPLRFVNLKLDKVSIPMDLINSFCDMSFHLTADLKIALNGFQILMVPIQVIFCIIDVICALLNPFKLAKAVIRLFQCLYDLILLLPQISVPVMFIQLILHLLQLLQCIIDKVIFMITVINEVINAIQLAVDGALWEALKSLEEVLSEYLLDLKADLSVLDPILSILAIFLQLLGLAFRFPCSISDEEDEFFCMDGSMLGGLVIGKALNDDGETYRFESLIPVGQAYSDKTLEEAAADGTSDPLVDPEDDFVCAVQTDSETYLDSMDVDTASLRSTYADNGGDFNLTFSASATKSKRGFGSPAIVKFLFKEKGRNGVFNKKKIIDPDQTLDGPIYLTKSSDNELLIETGSSKNLVSPIDGVKFLNIDGDTASVKPLELEIEVPIEEIDEETGEKVVVGTRTIPRTFDNIPRMALLDEELNVYFVEPDGIEFKDGIIDSIKAKIVNVTTAEKKKFLKEDVEFDSTPDDGVDEEDDEAPVYDFPQIHFFDMREVADDIESKCGFDFFNNDVLDDDPDDIADIVEEGQDCLEAYLAYMAELIAGIRESMVAGEVPGLIDVDAVTAKGVELEECLESVVDDICIYVVNSLNSQFKVLEDDDETPLSDFPDPSISDDLSDGFEISGPTMTGAREYAAGIGDSADIIAGEIATIQITPRDSYDNIVPGDLSEKIVLEFISDTTGVAEFIETDGKTIVLDGEDYIAQVTSSKPGIVKLRAKVCNKTIQAVTYAEVVEDLEEDSETEVDCVPDAPSVLDSATGSLGALTKVDRIITLFFVKGATVALSGTGDEEGSLAKPTPQAFGSDLEN